MCRNCGKKFIKVAANHLRGAGCDKCGKYKSKGEMYIISILDKYNIKHAREVILSGQNNKRYDFELSNSKILIEYDGRQHFEFNNYFHDDIDDFYYNFEKDVDKTIHAIKSGYILIRIDYNVKTTADLELHLENALRSIQSEYKLYLSSKLYIDLLSDVLERIPKLKYFIDDV